MSRLVYTNGTYRLFSANAPVSSSGSFGKAELEYYREEVSRLVFSWYTPESAEAASIKTWKDVYEDLKTRARKDELLVDGDEAIVTVLEFQSRFLTPLVIVFVTRNNIHRVFTRMTVATKFVLKHIQRWRNGVNYLIEPWSLTPQQMRAMVDHMVVLSAVAEFGDLELAYHRENGKINSRLNMMVFKVPQETLKSLLERTEGDDEERPCSQRIHNYLKQTIHLNLDRLRMYRVISRLVSISNDGRIKMWASRVGPNPKVVLQTFVRLADASG
ncbi:hypothetical protein DIURU_001418 [Diutina rugosa]|uniref:Uncharacterized protein n=1 Tax=Diutina rugosa TaxID=5481 RepID=A0A642V0Y9_DIURU|nr:uncharacterized protein DIURU_001418 [Diutina rugosa]KAA8905615.1 hypothetical protein DIURU_001418 [Diutina rugosa]